MNFSKRIIYISILLLFIASWVGGCKTENNKEKEFLSTALNSSEKTLTGFNYVIIIPGAGCHGCIQESEYFLKQNIQRKDILFIISNPQSIKILQNKIGLKLNDYSNVLINKTSDFKVPTHNSVYPAVVYLGEDKDIEKVEFQTPNTSAFHNLSLLLGSK
ncbi:MAG: hypothetical protein K2G90_07805 [Muribaculaceae bacterium]|nr:hypothetical protein [Muribaculaceae bacterium]